jgi:hypothetical protein
LVRSARTGRTTLTALLPSFRGRRRGQDAAPEISYLLRTVGHHGRRLTLGFRSDSAATALAPLSHMLISGFLLVQGFFIYVFCFPDLIDTTLRAKLPLPEGIVSLDNPSQGQFSRELETKVNNLPST